MSVTRIDFAVMGASPQARLIAGLLASRHKKSVLYQGESQSGYRLPRGVDLSVAPITRPETWALLQPLTLEARKLIAKIGGRNCISRIDPFFFAHTQAGSDAIGHLRHMAQAFKIPVERGRGQLPGSGKQGVLFRDALLLHRASLEPVLDQWLLAAGVHRVQMDTALTLRPDGSAEVLVGSQHFEIGQTILADDAAIVANLSAEQWPASIQRRTASTLLTEPTRQLAAALMYQLDSGIVLTQYARGGIAALGPGSIEEVGKAVRVLLGGDPGGQQAGQSSYERVTTTDGAPVVGRVGGTGPDIVAGFGTTGAFFAPALARWLAGDASEAENNWFAARLVDRDPAVSIVSDWGETR